MFMKDEEKSKDQLLSELRGARERIGNLEGAVAEKATNGGKGFVSNRFDETEYRQVLQALRNCEETFRAFAENALDVIMRFDRSFRHLYVNPAAEQGTGIPCQEFLGKTHAELGFPENLVKMWEKALQRVFDTAEPHRIEFMLPSGAWIDWLLVPEFKENGQVYAVMTSARDITRMKQAEEKLKESQQRFAEIIEFLPDATLVIDEKGQIIAWNRAMERMTGVTAEEMIGKGNYEYAIPFYGERRPILIDLVLKPHDEVLDKYRSISHYNGVIIGEAYMPNLKGGTVYLLGTAAPLYDMDGQIVGAIESIRDITDRRKAEEALTMANERFSEVLNSFDALVFVLDMASDDVLFVNRYGRSILGDLEGELCRQAIQQGRGGQGAYSTNELLVDAEGKPTAGMVWEFPQQINNRWYECRDRVIKWPDGRLVRLSIAIDITERKQAEAERQKLAERLHRAEKMEALGIMAGGVAHDLNNVLGVLVGYSELLLLGMPEDSRQRKHVNNILLSGQRGAAIIQDLLTLARRNVDISEVVNLNTVVSDYCRTPEFEMLKTSHPKVSFEVTLEENLLNLRGSPLHLGKTVMNLVSNAAEATAAGGRVVVGTQNRYLDRPILGYDNMEEGDYVVLTVSDNGQGISQTDIGKIFEPFYTRKIMGRSGTGLGLAVVWGTVKDHRGYIDVKSEEGKGSIFTLYFPVTRDEAMKSRGNATFEQYQGRGESILVVDDVAEQRELARRMLTRIGYRVATVSSGEEAIRYLRTHQADLLVLDMIMGSGLDGYETYQKIHESNPQQKAIIVSGFSETDRVRKAQALGAGAYVPKPYIMEQIGLAVRQELDRSNSGR
jgi:PAS domain S-box-containing protein